MESKLEKLEKLENYIVDEEMRSQSEERLCKSIVKGFARRNREKHATLAGVEEKKNKTSYALMTSPARNCCGTQCARLVTWS